MLHKKNMDSKLKKQGSMDMNFQDSVKRLLSPSIPRKMSVGKSLYLKKVDQEYHSDEDIQILEQYGIHTEKMYRNAPVPVLYEQALLNEKGSSISSTGALVTRSGTKTGRSPKDKRIVDEETTNKNVWWGPVNIKLSEHSFAVNRERALDYLNTKNQLYVVDGIAGWDEKYATKVRIICARAYHALFMRNMLRRPTPEELENFGEPDFVIYNAGQFPANRYTEGMGSSTSVSLNFKRQEMVILGTEYAGEMKKGVFTIMNYLMPLRGVLPLHSSCNEAKPEDGGKVSLFFGLSGTGKCLGKDTPVMMYDGTIKMVQDIKAGEQIMGDDSKPRNILSVCKGREKLYEVVGTKGAKYVVNESHILSLKAHKDHLDMYKTDGDVIDISIRDYFEKLPKSYTQNENSGLLCGYRVPVDFEMKNVNLDPYMLGYWLGNETSTEPHITTVDKEVIDYFSGELSKIDAELRLVENKKNDVGMTFGIVGSGEKYTGKDKDLFMNFLQEKNLFNNKHIPHDYKCNSREVRLSVLAGVIDSNGHYDKEGKGYEVVLKSEKLLDDIMFTSRSLGYHAMKKETTKTGTNGINGSVSGTHYRTFISGSNLEEIPVLLSRKQAEKKLQVDDVLKYSINVNPLEEGDYFGFEIDGNKRFLLGDFTVTHNTTLSADPNRNLIGDDEHVWTEEGVFNIEGGCYAKCIDLSREKEPEIFDAIKFGSVLENVKYIKDHGDFELDKSREVDYTSSKITENTRCAYPLEYIPNSKVPAVTDKHPSNVIMLTCDAFGVLPPVSKLSISQAMYHFISGYTAKVAGTEDGITEPTTTFSACFGEPFLVHHPVVYAKLLAKKLETHGAEAWLVNTGWVGGSASSKEGKRCPLKYTRAIIDAIHNGELEKQETTEIDVFGLRVPKKCPGVPEELLTPRASWGNKELYDQSVKKLAKEFIQNMSKSYPEVEKSILEGGPKV